jgi:hypothetical protein
MAHFISYFDYLGYKEFILKNSSEEIRRRVGHFLRDIETSLGLGKFQEPQGGWIIADLTHSRINCLNISDTIIFWTNDDSLESFMELLKVSFDFNWREILHNVPTRGAMVYADVELLTSRSQNDVGGTYNVNMIYGKGLVEAHIKAENQNWAGFVIDNSVITKLATMANVASTLDPFAVQYKVPYKNNVGNQENEYVFRLNTGSPKLNPVAFGNWSKNITDGFSRDNKNPNNPRAQEILANTLAYLEIFRE